MLTQTKREIAELREKYLEYLQNNRYSIQTIKNEDYALRSLEHFLEGQGIERIADVTTETIGEYNQFIRNHKDEETGKSYNISTITGKLQPVKYFFCWLTRNMIILYDPAKDMEIPTMKKGLPRTILSEEEISIFIELPDTKTAIGYRDRTIFELFLRHWHEKHGNENPESPGHRLRSQNNPHQRRQRQQRTPAPLNHGIL